MQAASAPERSSPVRVALAELIQLRAAGEALNLTTPRVRALASGGHRSPYKGRGVEFDESRPYQPGDDMRSIDWRVTARTGKPHTKVFREERNRPVIVWLDLRRPMLFATRGAYKAVRAAETAALIAWSGIANGDRLGGLVFSEREHRELRPGLGRRAALRLFQSIVQPPFWEAERGGADAADGGAERALQRLVRVARPGSLIFLLSDFRNLGEDFERPLRQLASHGDVRLVHFFDPLETELPPPGRYRIETGGRVFAIETGSQPMRARYRAQFLARRERLAAAGRQPGVHLMECATTDDPRRLLAEHFRTR